MHSFNNTTVLDINTLCQCTTLNLSRLTHSFNNTIVLDSNTLCQCATLDLVRLMHHFNTTTVLGEKVSELLLPEN